VVEVRKKMKKKIIGILVCTLLIGTAALPIAMSMNDLKDGKDVSMLNKKNGCCQNGGQPIQLTVGRCDGFDPAPPPELTAPSNILLDWIDKNYQGTSGSRDCDEDVTDQFWAHTFNLTGLCCDCCIVKATLNITVKNLHSNDGLNVGCIDSDSDSWDIHDTLINWGVNVGDEGIIEIDLSGDYPSFFSDMVDHCYLDVIVQDDSMVDCATLTIWCCEPDVIFEKKVWDSDAQKWVEEIDACVCTIVKFYIDITNWGPCDLENVKVVDHLPFFMEYEPGGISEWPNHLVVNGNVLTWSGLPTIPPRRHLYIEYNAHVTSSGVGENCADLFANSGTDSVSDSDCAIVTGIMCKSKWIQPPNDCTGIYIVNHGGTEDHSAADDFNCTSTGPITNITLWGSVGSESWSRLIVFTLSIYSDKPDPDDSGPLYSMPDKMLWTRSFNYYGAYNQDSYNVSDYCKCSNGFLYDPSTDYFVPNYEHNIYQFDFNIQSCDAFIQNGTEEDPVVYWLVVKPQMDWLLFPFYLMTSKDHWNDDAVYRKDSVSSWLEMRYPTGHPNATESIDMAFRIASTTGNMSKSPNPPIITGSTSGKVGISYTYTFTATDPDGDNVKYYINWDDGNSETTAFSSSGTDVKVKHTWTTGGTYTIKATAEDSNGLVGPEGTLLVSMPRNRATTSSFLQFLENFLENHPILYQLLQRFLQF